MVKMGEFKRVGPRTRSWWAFRALLSYAYRTGGFANHRSGSTQLHVYDLKTNAWNFMYDSSDSTGPEEWDMSYKLVEPAVLHGGVWYYLAHAHHFWEPRNHDATYVFRVEKGVAEALKAPLPDQPGLIVDFLHLFVSQGKLILAGSLKTKDNLTFNEWAQFRLWMLDEERS
jgi:hypothetical protein